MDSKENTIFEDQILHPQKPNMYDPTLYNESSKETPNLKKRAAMVAAAILSGGALGAGAAYGAHQLIQEAQEKTHAEEAMKIVTESDDKSFEEAFIDARAQLGSGAAFRWHGAVYSTYTEDEWNSMSQEEQAAYNARVQPLMTEEELHASYDSNVQAHTDIHEVTTEERVNTTHIHHTQRVISDDQYTISHEEQVEVQGQQVIMANGTHDGRPVVLLDVDRDGVYDVAIEDRNGDGEVTDDECVDISGKHIAVADASLISGGVTPVVDPNGQEGIVINSEEEQEIEGQKVIFAEGTVGGHKAIFMDINHDGVYDRALVDANGNGNLEDEEPINISSYNICVRDTSLVGGAMMVNNPGVTDPELDDPSQQLPDYVNHAFDSDDAEPHPSYASNEISATENDDAQNEVALGNVDDSTNSPVDGTFDAYNQTAFEDQNINTGCGMDDIMSGHDDTVV